VQILFILHDENRLLRGDRRFCRLLGKGTVLAARAEEATLLPVAAPPTEKESYWPRSMRSS
jgi:hypothetical protein